MCFVRIVLMFFKNYFRRIFMELIYTYIGNINRHINNQGFNYSGNYEVEVMNRELIIKNKKNELEGFFGKYTQNISLVIGKNASGKSTLLDIIGLNKLSVQKNYPRGKFFSIFHIDADVFYCVGNSVSKIINNMEVGKENIKEFFFKQVKSNSFKIIDFNEALNTKDKITLCYCPTNIKKTIFEEKEIVIGNDFFINRDIKYDTNQNDFLNMINKYLFDDINIGTIKVFFKYKKRNNFKNACKYLYTPLRRINSSGTKEILEEEIDYLKNIKDGRYGDIKQEFIYDFLETEIVSFISHRLNNKNNSLFSELMKDYTYKFDYIDYQILEKTDYYALINYSKEVMNEYFYIKKNNRLESSELIKKLQNDISIFFDDLRLLIVTLENIPSHSYSDTKKIMQDISNFNQEGYKSLVSSNKFKITFSGLSDGQISYLENYSKLFNVFLNCKTKKLIIILDEPDLGLHPEWSRKYIYNLIELINHFKINTQVILSTHSPFLLSDIPKNNVISLNTCIDKNKNQKVIVDIVENSFAANVYDILQDTFFMDYPIGEFARNKIEKNERRTINLIDDELYRRIILKNGGKVDDKNSNDS